MTKTVLITGGNGFIGKSLRKAYLGKGYSVKGVDLIANPELNVIAGDVSDPKQWQAYLEGVDIVIHTAAVVSMVAPMDVAWKVNVRGTQRLLNCAAKCGVGHFILLSSVAAMGFDAPDGADESLPVKPIGNCYVDTKIASEHVVLSAHASGLINCTIIRPGDVYGPESRAWIHEPLKLMQNGQFLLPANGQGVFSPVYIDDLLSGIVLVSENDQALGQIFIISGGEGISCMEFFSHHWRWLGKSGTPRSLPTRMAVFLAETIKFTSKLFSKKSEMGKGTVLLLARPGTYDISKAKKLLGYQPKVDLESGLAQCKQALQEQKLI